MTINNDGMTYEEKKTNWMSCYSFDDANQIKYAVKKGHILSQLLINKTSWPTSSTTLIPKEMK
jgi:hypothetical protein